MTYNPLKDELDRLLNEKLEKYTWKLIRAQKAERIKLCPFCLENITVSHFGRDFCPKKNGNKDFFTPFIYIVKEFDWIMSLDL